MDPAVVMTKAGRVRGAREAGVSVFRGIPFAEPPVGPLRWQPPRPHPTWDGIRDALSFGPTCPQFDDLIPPGHPLKPGWQPEPHDEDCLFVNVWTPGADDAHRPVLVWIHGGNFTMGSGSQPNSQMETFTRHGIVGVSFNYRLGPLGFLHLDDLFDGFSRSGNSGMLDQIAALEWVRDNIASFGGDPSRVTIAGVSAGGMSVGALMGMPPAKGLFARAVPQSGAAHHALRSDTATRIARELLRRVGIEPGDRAALEAASGQDLAFAAITLQAHLANDADFCVQTLGEDRMKEMPFLPVIDGETLCEAPIDAIRGGHAGGVTTMVGTTADEARLGTHTKIEGAPEFVPNRAIMASRFARSATTLDEAEAVYAKLQPESDEKDINSAMVTDATFGVPAVRLADAQSRHADVYAYLLRYPVNEQLGACHGMDIPLVFDRLDLGLGVLMGESARPLAVVMNRAWASFVRTGDPNTDGLPPWPTYDPARRQTMCLDLPGSEVIDDPTGDRVAVWDHW